MYTYTMWSIAIRQFYLLDERCTICYPEISRGGRTVRRFNRKQITKHKSAAVYNLLECAENQVQNVHISNNLLRAGARLSLPDCTAITWDPKCVFIVNIFLPLDSLFDQSTDGLTIEIFISTLASINISIYLLQNSSGARKSGARERRISENPEVECRLYFNARKLYPGTRYDCRNAPEPTGAKSFSW